jgi:hypothetical protein
MNKAIGSDDGEGVTVTLHLSRSVVDHFKALGPDWERIMGDALTRAAGLPSRLPSRAPVDQDFISDGNEG